MATNKNDRQLFDPENIPVVGSLGILALGDIGFAAWRKVKIKNNSSDLDGKE